MWISNGYNLYGQKFYLYTQRNVNNTNKNDLLYDIILCRKLDESCILVG